MKESEALKWMREHRPEFMQAIKDGQRLGILTTEASARAIPEKLLVAAGGYRNVDNSVRATCERCRRACYLSPSTQRMLADRKGPSEIVCWDCAQNQMEKDRNEMGSRAFTR